MFTTCLPYIVYPQLFCMLQSPKQGHYFFSPVCEQLNSRSEFKEDSVDNVFEPLLNKLCTSKECSGNFPSHLSLLIRCRKQFTSLGEFMKDTEVKENSIGGNLEGGSYLLKD